MATRDESVAETAAIHDVRGGNAVPTRTLSRRGSSRAEQPPGARARCCSRAVADAKRRRLAQLCLRTGPCSQLQCSLSRVDRIVIHRVIQDYGEMNLEPGAREDAVAAIPPATSRAPNTAFHTLRSYPQRDRGSRGEGQRAARDGGPGSLSSAARRRERFYQPLQSATCADRSKSLQCSQSKRPRGWCGGLRGVSLLHSQ